MLLGKLATHEFAIGGPSFDLPFPPARNPWNLGALHRRFVVRLRRRGRRGHGAHGDGLGHRRLDPRAGGCWCGTVGLKPTYGRVSRRGVFPLSCTLDQCGPLACTVEDAAITMQVIAGHDPHDPASADRAGARLSRDLEKGLQGCASAYPRAFFANAQAMTAEVVAALDAAAQQLASSAPRSRTSSCPTTRCSTRAAA